MSGIRCQERKGFHLQWIQFPFLEIFSREGLDQAFKQLSDNNEIIQTTTTTLKTSDHTPSISQSLFSHLPDFNTNYKPDKGLTQFLLHFQSRIELSATNLFIDSPCIIVLQQRLAVMTRLCQSIEDNHKLFVKREQQLKGDNGGDMPLTQETTAPRVYSPTELLVETGVRTGLQLFFSLLKQQLLSHLTHPHTDVMLCSEVLTSLRDTLSHFPPTFLSSDHKLSPLSISCISDADRFLQQIVFHTSPIDTSCRSIAAETQLTLTAGRASLGRMLEYFSKVLEAKSGTAGGADVSDTTPYISREHLQQILNEMHLTKVESVEDTEVAPVQVEAEQVTLYRATFLLFKQLVLLAGRRLGSFSVCGAGTPACEVFGFGSNGSGQFGLGNGSIDKSAKPIRLAEMANCSYVCAGQNCTFVVYPDGCYKACGKGSYGRLGTGDTNNLVSLTKVEIIGVKFVRICSSKGSDGHSLGLTSEGLVYSWGEGESGRLGHGNSIPYHSPKLIQGPLFGKIIKSISVGSKHSAAVSLTGELYTWGEGDSGKLGHNNSTSQSLPTLVSAISGVMQVSCGTSHTLALSREGTVWSWGSPEGGKLGHGDMTKKIVPKEILFLRDICKIQAGNHVSVALSTDGKVFSWGNGPALGLYESDTACLVPTRIHSSLENEFVIDVSVGDTHCLALTRKHEVYAWGNNNNGQCGIGHLETRVSFPTKVLKPETADIYQISAGLSHSVIWTAIPTDMSDSLKNWPYCLDMKENTFRLLREFLEKYCTGFEMNKPFDSVEDNNEFVVYCLNLLKIHLKCVVLLSNPKDCIGQEIIPLGQLLFKLMDSSTPQPIQDAVNETLELGATLLIPPLPERLHFIWYLMPKDSSQWTHLTKGQLIQLQVMLESLSDEHTVIALLMPLIPQADTQCSETIERADAKNRTLLQLVDIMMRYVLAFMDKKIDECKTPPLASGTDGSDTLTTQMSQGISPKIISLFKNFLILLYKHIFANFALKTEFTEGQINFLRQHLDTIIPGCLECLEKIKLLALTNPENLNIINELSFPNAIIPLVTHGLLLFPLHQLNYLTDLITDLCLQLSRTVESIPNLAFICECQEAEWKIGELDNPLLASPLSFPLSSELASDWCWLVDTHRCGACLLGLLINLQLTSLPVETRENSVIQWTSSVLLANGMVDSYREGIMQWKQSTNGIMSQLPFSTEEIAESVLKYETAVPSLDIPETDPVAQLILDLAHARIEMNHTCSEAYTQLIQFATVREWDTNTDDDITGLREVSCGMLAAVAKHCRISVLTPLHGHKTSDELSEAYESIFRVRRELFSLRPLDTSVDDTQSGTETEYSQLCATIRSLCLFLVQVVSPATREVTDGTAPSISQSRKHIKSPKNSIQIAGTSKPPSETSNSQSEKDSPLESIAEYFQPKDTLKSSDNSIQTPSLSSSIIRTLTQFLLEPIYAYRAKHFKEEQASPSVLAEPANSAIEKNEKLLENIAFTMAKHKKRAELRLESLKLVQCLLLSRGSKPIGQISSILPTAYRLLQTSLLGNSGVSQDNATPFVIMGNIASAPRELQIKIKSAFNKILSYVFKQIAQAAKACTKAVEKEKVPLYLDLVINMSWLQGKVESFDINEVCSPQILSVLAELSGIISTKLPLPFPVDNTLEKCIRNIAALLFYYITAVVGYNAEDLNSSVLESVVGLLYGELEGQFIPYKPKISCKIPPADPSKQRSIILESSDNTNDLQIQTPIDFFDLSLPFEFNHPVHPETLKQLEKLWSTISSDDREYSMGSYINYLTRVVSTAKMKAHFANTAWVGLLLRIAGVDPENCLPRCMSIRTRMLALNLLSNILMDHPRESVAVKKKIIDVIFNQMSLCQFGQPVFHIKKCDTDTTTEFDNKPVRVNKCTFENMSNSKACSIEGNLIQKITRGDGFVFINYKLSYQIYSWKIKLVNSDNAINSVFIGVVSMPFQDTAIKSTQCCWTVDTFSGNLFHNGQLPELFTSCVTGDTIQCVYNGVTKKLSFAKNTEPPVEVFENIKATEIYPFISFNSKSTTATVEFNGLDLNTYTPTNRDTLEQITSELSHGFTPKPLVNQQICIGEGFTRLLRQLLQSERWQNPIQYCCNERFSLMDSIVQSLVNRTLTGHVEVHRLCFQIWPVLSFLANRNAVLSVGGGVYYEDENLYGIISLNYQRQPSVFFETKGTKIQSPMLLPTDKVDPVSLPKLDGFNWAQIGPITLLNLAHLSGLWDDEEMNVLTAGAPFLSRGYAKHLLTGQDAMDVTHSSSAVPINVTGSLEWRQILMWEVQAMALRTLQTVLTQDRFLQLLTYHPISISDQTLTEDKADLSQAVQQIMRHIVTRSTSPSPLVPAVSLACLETAHGLLIRNSILKLYTDCADAILGGDKLDEKELSIVHIPTPPPDLPKIYHPTNVPPPIPPKTRHVSPAPLSPVATPTYVTQLLEMGFSEQQVNRARRKLKLNSNESIANQTSSLVMWLLEHASEEDSGGETAEPPPPLPPREDPVFPLTLEQTLAREEYPPSQAPLTPPADPSLLSAERQPKSDTDRFLEGLFPDFNRTDFSVAKNLGKRNGNACKDLLEGPDPTAFVRDVYRNIPEVSGEMKDNCKLLFFKKNEGFLSSKSELKQSSSSDDPLGTQTVKSNKLSPEKEDVFSRADTQLLNQCNQVNTLDDYVNSMERITNAIKTQISRQLLLLACSSLSLKPDDFIYGLTNIGIQELTLLLRLLRLSATNRFGYFSSDLDNSICIISAIKQVLSKDSVSLGRMLQICTRDILAAAATATVSPESYFLSAHSNISDSTVFATINFQVTQMLVEVVIDVINSPEYKHRKYDQSDVCVYGVISLADALCACEFSERLTSDNKQWVTEQIVRILIVPKECTAHSTVKPELTLVEALLELQGHSKQVMATVWSEKTTQLFSISKDNTIRIWKSRKSVDNKLLINTSTLDFSSETQTPTDQQETPPKLINPTVLPYIAVDYSGEYIAASRQHTINVWYTEYINNNNNNNNKQTLRCIQKLNKLVTFSCFKTPCTNSPTTKEPIEYIPSLLSGCIDGSVYSAAVKLDSGEGKLSLEFIELEDMRLYDNGAVVKMVWDESGHTLAIGSSKGSVTIFSQENNSGRICRDKTLVLHENVVHSLQFNSSGTLLATLADGEAIKISGRLNGEWDNIGFIALPNQTCFSWLHSQIPQSKDFIACGGDRGFVYVWSLPHWPYDIQVASQSDATSLLDKQLEQIVTCYSISSGVTCLTFSIDGMFVLAGHKDGTVSMWLASSGEELVYTQTNNPVVSITPSSDRIITCHLNSSNLHYLPITPDIIFKTRTLYYCNAKLRSYGLEKNPFLQAFLSQLGNILYRRHISEQEDISNQKQLVHSRMHQSLSALAIGLGLDIVWTQVYLSRLFPQAKLNGEYDCENWSWISRFRQALLAVECMGRRSALPSDFPGMPTEASEREEQLSENWSVEMDSQLMQWSNQNPEDWILGGRAKVYFWGAGSSGQLANDCKSTCRPELCSVMECSQRVIASVNCTYAINHDGSVYSFGDGAYGKLGHNSTEAFSLPQCIEALQGYIVVQLCASRGGNAHCLALSQSGEVFSWGDGEYGRLGHGDTAKQRKPKRIEALIGKRIVMVSVGEKYSAVVTDEGHLYTFGNGSDGKMGLGNTDSKRVPKQVTKFLKEGEEISVKIGQVSCSSGHTLAVTSDGKEVFSFGEGLYYKLGHGSITNVLTPQAIPLLSGLGIKKVACGNQFSLALTNNGKLFAWGHHAECCSATNVHTPQLLASSSTEGLASKTILDVQAGPDYAIALTSCGEVWAWGSNKEGQLGLGDKDPRIQPCLIKDLSGKNIRQISAGKCHAAASTAPPLSFLNLLEELGEPSCVPSKYTALSNIKISLLRSRLKLLTHFSSTVYSQWTLFCSNPFEFSSIDVLQTCLLNKANIRPILSQNRFRSKMLQTLTHTMIASKSYGPIITVRRIPSEGHKHKPLFYQISPQILSKTKELLLPQRAWKVTLIGEGADDAGGVFDETIALMCIELQDGTLPFLIPTPNARNKCGYNTDRFVFNPACCSRNDTDYYKFIGIMFGVAIRTKKPLALHLAPLVWKLMAGIEITMDDLEEVDSAFMQAMRGIRQLSEDVTPETFSEMIPISCYEAYNMAGLLFPILTGGSSIPLTYANRKEYVDKSIQFRLHELDRQALAVREGMSLIVPVPLLSLTTAGMLEIAVCGEKELDIQVLKRVAKYRDCSANDTLIQWLWDSLENFTNEDKILFLRFTSGRSRLPARVQDVTQRLLVIKTVKNKNALPTAQTCFFQLKLPNYSSQEILSSRLRYAINNCRSIDTDGYMLPRNTEGGGTSSDDTDY